MLENMWQQRDHGQELYPTPWASYILDQWLQYRHDRDEDQKQPLPNEFLSSLMISFLDGDRDVGEDEGNIIHRSTQADDTAALD